MTDQATPETDDFRPCHLTPSDWPAFARAMEIQRNAARADVALITAENERLATGNHSMEKEVPELRRALEKALAERDTANALTLSLCADRDGDAKDRDDEIAVLRADVARLRDALEGMLIAEMEVRQMDGWAADEAETEPHWMAARAALATPAK
jgi:hypothetical protein